MFVCIKREEEEEEEEEKVTKPVRTSAG
jgi:hypothetical protein